MTRAFAMCGVVLCLPLVAMAQESRGKRMPDDVFLLWTLKAVPILKHMETLGFHTEDGVTRNARGVIAEIEGFCVWQPIPNTILLANHIDCPRLTKAMEHR